MIIFWQNTVSPHQAQTISELGAMTEVCWYVDKLISESRRKQGWKVPEVPHVHVKQLTVADVKGVFDQVSEDTLHIFSPRGSKLSHEVSRLVLQRESRYALLLEKANGRGIKIALNKLFYRWLGWKFRRAEFTLAMGNKGAEFYRDLNFPNVFPYGYTVEKVPVVPKSRRTETYEFVCVAQLIELKNHRSLFRALQEVNGGWRLTILGRGHLEHGLKRLAVELGLNDRIRWIETLCNQDAQQLIADSDTLILASNQEGWGAVVNEAISQGTRVIVSDAAGVACLCDLPDAGDIFISGSVIDLKRLLECHRARGCVTSNERRQRAALSDRFDGLAMAKFFMDVMRGQASASPWK